MKQIVDQFFRLISPDVSPVPCPFAGQKGQTKQAHAKPDIVYAGQPFQYVPDTAPDTYEEIRMGYGQMDRDKGLSETEKETAGQKFDMAKYTELKALWAQGYSAAKAAQVYKGRRGFGQRTIETYWSAFNSIGVETTE